MKFHFQPLSLALLAWACSWSQSSAQQSGLVPTQPQMHTDKLGNDWYVEQNGQLSRQGGGNSILSGAMTLYVGSEQFYCNQPMATPDGKELVLTGGQPVQGLQITRHLRYLEKEGGMRYLELLTNPSGNDLSISLELRNNFSGQVKSFLSNTARVIKGSLEKDETSVAVIPGTANYHAYVFTVSGPRSASKPRVVTQNQYQLSFFHKVTVPAGKSVAILHTVTQGKLSLRPDTADLEKLLKPFALARHLKDLPKGSAALLVNLRMANMGPLDLTAWFPEEILGIKREATDVLAMGEGTRLRGRASCAKLTLQHGLGKIVLPWEEVIAISGARSESSHSQVYLADGQILRGHLEAEELKFTLSTGLPIQLKITELDRIVRSSLGTPAEWPKGISALVETDERERLAVVDIAGVMLQLNTAWGGRLVPMGDIAAISPGGEEFSQPQVSLRDGTKLHVWLGGQDHLTVKTKLFGSQTLPSTRVQALAVGEAILAPADSLGEEAEPQVAFADLMGEQRLVAALAESQMQVVTAGGLVPLDATSFKEMRNVSEDHQKTGPDDSPWFQIELWGGGSVLGQLRENALRFRAGDADWFVPARELVRMVNPAPKIADTLLNRIGQLIRELGNENWKIREKASAELRTLGEMARAPMQEAFKQNEDVEVKHRLEQLMSELE